MQTVDHAQDNYYNPKADMERLYIPRKDGGRGLIEVETAFKTATIGLDHYLKNKDGQYPNQVLGPDRSKAKNLITKNMSKFKREVPMSEFENKEDKSPSENAKALKNINYQVLDEIDERGKGEKQSSTWSIPKAPRGATC